MLSRFRNVIMHSTHAHTMAMHSRPASCGQRLFIGKTRARNGWKEKKIVLLTHFFASYTIVFEPFQNIPFLDQLWRKNHFGISGFVLESVYSKWLQINDLRVTRDQRIGKSSYITILLILFSCFLTYCINVVSQVRSDEKLTPRYLFGWEHDSLHIKWCIWQSWMMLSREDDVTAFREI